MPTERNFHQAAVLATEREVARLLAALETSTGSYVDGLELCNEDQTTVADDRQQLYRRIRIDLRPAPGSHWAT